MIQAFKQALPILEKIEKAGYQAYFVGGSVRDLLLNQEIHDVDIATSATPDEVMGIFNNTVDVGIEHGTVVVIYGGSTYEVTTFRTESEYSDFRRPNEVSFVRSLNEDLMRRDFTMNAIAMDKSGVMLDPFNGKKDIEAKVIRTVGEPKERFQEDALRMMRAVRFVSQLSFSIEIMTYKALKVYGSLLKHIAIERIAVEFEKLLLGRNSRNALKILLDTGLYQYLPGLYGKREALYDFLKVAGDRSLSSEEHWVLLLHHLQIAISDVDMFLRKWKQPVKKIKRIKKGLIWLDFRLKQQWTIVHAYKAQPDLVMSTEKLYHSLTDRDDNGVLQALQQMLTSMPIQKRSDLAVTGKDLIQWFDQRGGPWVEETLVKIEEAVLIKETDNTREGIREWLFKCNQS
ncbi:CCA tRNA nucleotidyltransferase [Bacillus dakarensis]|uniref:CCA tRNA nucleotidyltransferase n=1 Tax=Robertmurraya dakarensis TaxID=1926278 RepID=UPI000980A673|nr:CCA tRNA nucleotidyltransferase [Bacillus dakarensis]